MFHDSFPPNIGLSKTYIPQTIMTVKSLNWKKILKLPSGAYAQLHEYRNITNTLRERTQGEICLGPTGNIQVTYNFLSLITGKNITRGQFTEVPMIKLLLKRVAAMAMAKKQSEGLILGNRTRIAVNYILPNDDANKAL